MNPSYRNLTTYLIKSSQTQTQRRRERNAPKPNISKHSVPKGGRHPSHWLMFGGALEPLIGEGAARNEKRNAVTKWITHTHTHTHTGPCAALQISTLTSGAPIPGPSPFKPNGLEINPDPFQPNGLEIKGSCDRSNK